MPKFSLSTYGGRALKEMTYAELCDLRFKRFLIRAGEHLSSKTILSLHSALNYLEVGRWMRAHGYRVPRRARYREELFHLAASEIADRNVLYLEFGVWQGEVTDYWSKLLRNPESKLHGFDSFEGLPENWYAMTKGGFSVAGQVPQTEDSRVQFFKGWFEETLPRYQFPAHEVLVLNLDADLYSSTRFVLKTVREQIQPGTYLYFDNFNQPLHEVRAFGEFVEETKMKFELLGATYALGNVLFQRTG
jgi:hypothetical protein